MGENNDVFIHIPDTNEKGTALFARVGLMTSLSPGCADTGASPSGAQSDRPVQRRPQCLTPVSGCQRPTAEVR